MPAPKGNKNAALPVKPDGYLHIKMPRTFKGECARAAYPGTLADWIIEAMAEKLHRDRE
jgi:hypothetical protein